MGIRYRSVYASLGPTSSLPAPAETALRDLIGFQTQRDRGRTRNRNDQAVDSRAGHFQRWSIKYGYDTELFRRLSDGECLNTLALFLHDVANGHNLVTTDTLTPSTLTNYLVAAKHYLQLVRGCFLQTHCPENPNNLHPVLAHQLAFRRKWFRPSDRREPITHDMFANLATRVRLLLDASPASHILFLPTVYDWLCLGIFTGSRAGEYAQTNGSKHQYSPVPHCPNDPSWVGKPIAFVASDFTFLTAQNQEITAARAPAHLSLVAVRIRFRHDKSKWNFTTRTFRRAQHPFLCPLQATLCILIRAQTLHLPPSEPLACYKETLSSPTPVYLTSAVIVAELRKTCVLAFPNPSHYHRRHIKCLVAHSTRVTVAVALWNCGVPPETIAFRLRWTQQSVEHYLRDCSKAIGPLTTKAIMGAMSI